MFVSIVVFGFVAVLFSPECGCKNEIASNIYHTIVICVHTCLLLWLLLKWNSTTIEYPGKRREYIERIRQVRDLLDGCSDDLTQIQRPGPPEYLEGDNLIGVYVRVVYIWILLIIISAYGIYNGIILGIWFGFKNCRKNSMKTIKTEDINSTLNELEMGQSMN